MSDSDDQMEWSTMTASPFGSRTKCSVPFPKGDFGVICLKGKRSCFMKQSHGRAILSRSAAGSACLKVAIGKTKPPDARAFRDRRLAKHTGQPAGNRLRGGCVTR